MITSMAIWTLVLIGFVFITGASAIRTAGETVGTVTETVVQNIETVTQVVGSFVTGKAG